VATRPKRNSFNPLRQKLTSKPWAKQELARCWLAKMSARRVPVGEPTPIVSLARKCLGMMFELLARCNDRFLNPHLESSNINLFGYLFGKNLITPIIPFCVRQLHEFTPVPYGTASFGVALFPGTFVPGYDPHRSLRDISQ